MPTSAIPPVSVPKIITPGSRNDAQPGVAGEVEQQQDTAAIVQNSVQVADETTASATQFVNRRYLTEQLTDRNNFYEASLEEQPEIKAQMIARTASRQELSTGDLLKYISKAIPDESDLIIILREMLRKKKMDEAAAGKIRELLTLFEESVDKKAVYAGINCAIKAKLFGRALALKPTYLRALYRDFLFSELHPVEFYLRLIGSFSSKKRRMILAYLESALSADSKAMDASCSSREFGEFLNKLTQLQLLQAAEQLFIEKLRHNKVIKKINIEENQWVEFLMAMLMNPPGIESLIDDIVDNKMKKASEREISVLLLAIFSCVKSLPQGLFQDEGVIAEITEYFLALFRKRLLPGAEIKFISP